MKACAPTLAALLVSAACGADPPADDGPRRDETFPGLTAQVEILWDDLGIPHVYGATDADAYYGAGYAMASARLFQMDQLRRRALGRWAEVMGAERRPDDELSRLLGFARLAERDADLLAESHPDAWELVVAWAAGINARIDEVRSGAASMPYGFAELGYEPEQWAPVDLVAVSRAAFFSTSNTLEAELLLSIVRNTRPDLVDAVQLIAPMFPVCSLPAEDRPTTRVAPLPPPVRPTAIEASPDELREAAHALVRLHRSLAPFRGVGSNNFAVHGMHTESGRSLIANDPHLGFESPNVMFALHIDSASGGGTFDVAGFTLAGSLGVSLGHNRDVAWTATTSFADVMDVWEVRLVPGGVEIGGETVAIEALDEPIVVRGPDMPVGEGFTVGYTVKLVPGYGVLLPSDLTPVPVARPGHAILLGYVGFEPFSGSDGLLALQRAASVAEVEAAIDRVPGLGFNFVMADSTDVAYRVGQAVPDRGAPSDARAPWLALDGSDPATLWTGALLPPEQLPRTRAEMRGWVTTSNNDPWCFTADGSLDGDPWYYGAIFDPGYRAQRLESELARLAMRGAVTVDDLRALQLDVRSSAADVLVPMLTEAHGRIETDDSLAELRGDARLDALVASLEAWDRRMALGSTDAVAFRALAFTVAAGVLRDEIGALYDAALEIPVGAFILIKIAVMALRGDYVGGHVILEEGRDLILLRAARDVAAWLDGTVTYGELHGAVFDATFRGALDVPFTPTNGAEDTIDNGPASFSLEPGARWESRFGPVYRVVTSFADDGTPEAAITMPIGNAGDPASPHFGDTHDAWAAGEHAPFPFRRAEVEARMERREVRSP